MGYNQSEGMFPTQRIVHWLVKEKMAAVSPVTVPVTVYVPAVPLAVAVTGATPKLLVVAVTADKLAPAPFAATTTAKVTTPPTGIAAGIRNRYLQRRESCSDCNALGSSRRCLHRDRKTHSIG